MSTAMAARLETRTAPERFDVDSWRAQFPILRQSVHGHPLAYLDSAATSQKPECVIEAIADYYRDDNANIHRGVYPLSERATLAWEAARQCVAEFIHAPRADDVVFVRGTTEAINLVANSFVRQRVTQHPVVVVTEMEHHANIVPWQLVGAQTVPIPITDRGELDLDQARVLLAQQPAPALLAVVHVSNTLGTVNPIAALCDLAHQAGVPVLVDGAQAAPHLPIDVAALGADFHCFSSHKVFGPMGIGVLWAREGLLDAMPPYQGGGDMINEVRFDRTTFAPPPRRFEAGTPHVAGAVGLARALQWLMAQDRDGLHEHEMALRDHAHEVLREIPGLRTLPSTPPGNQAAVVSFTLEGVHPHDIASLLAEQGVCVRAGHHCTQPLHRRLGVVASARASFAGYNTLAEVDALARGLRHVREVFAR